MKESRKAAYRRYLEGWYDRYIIGEGIDIGCGDDPLTPTCVQWDLPQGDATTMLGCAAESFDWVYSSHCLEHLANPAAALLRWWSLVRPGGYLLLAVPDEDRYERTFFPSLYNPDHKWSFTIHADRSWSPRSLNLLDLIAPLPNHQLESVRTFGPDQSNVSGADWQDPSVGDTEIGIEAIVRKRSSDDEYLVRTALAELVLCPNCARAELTIMGVDTDGLLAAKCANCGFVNGIDFSTLKGNENG